MPSKIAIFAAIFLAFGSSVFAHERDVSVFSDALKKIEPRLRLAEKKNTFDDDEKIYRELSELVTTLEGLTRAAEIRARSFATGSAPPTENAGHDDVAADTHPADKETAAKEALAFRRALEKANELYQRARSLAHSTDARRAEEEEKSGGVPQATLQLLQALLPERPRVGRDKIDSDNLPTNIMNSRDAILHADTTIERSRRTLAVVSTDAPREQIESRAEIAAKYFAEHSVVSPTIADWRKEVEAFRIAHGGVKPDLAYSGHGNDEFVTLSPGETLSAADLNDNTARGRQFRALAPHINSFSFRSCEGAAALYLPNGQFNPCSLQYAAAQALPGIPVAAYDVKTSAGLAPAGATRYTLTVPPYNPYPRLVEWRRRWLPGLGDQ